MRKVIFDCIFDPFSRAWKLALSPIYRAKTYPIKSQYKPEKPDLRKIEIKCITKEYEKDYFDPKFVQNYLNGVRGESLQVIKR